MSDIDLDALDALANKNTRQTWSDVATLVDAVPALTARVRELEADLAERQQERDTWARIYFGRTAEVARLRARVDAVTALHQPVPVPTSGSSDPNHETTWTFVCRHCGPLPYPCATAAALTTGAES